MKHFVIFKLVTLFLIFSLCLTAIGFAAEAVDTSTYIATTADQLKQYLSNTESGSVIKLGNDITIDSTIKLKYSLTTGNNITLDLNGYALTYAPATSTSDSYAIYNEYRWSFILANTGAIDGKLVNNSNGDYFFKSSGGCSFTVTGNFTGDVTLNSSLTLLNAKINGNLVASGITIPAASVCSVTGSLYAKSLLTMTNATSSLSVLGDTTVGKSAVIYSLSAFSGNLNIGENYSNSVSGNITTEIYGGTFKGQVNIARNISLSNAAAKYIIKIYDGKYYNSLHLGSITDNSVGICTATVSRGTFYKGAFITGKTVNITGGNFNYTFYDENNNELKTLTVRYGAKIYAPAIPVKQGYTFAGWSGYADGMTAGNVYSFTATYIEGGEGNTVETVNTPVQYTKSGIAIEGALSMVTDLSDVGYTFDPLTGALVATTSFYGITGYIPAKPGDIFRISALDTTYLTGKSSVACYDASYKYLGCFVNNSISGYTYKGRNVKDFSLGIINSTAYLFDYELQIPSTTEASSLFGTVAYIRVKACKSLSGQIVAQEDFYVAHIGNGQTEINTDIYKPQTDPRSIPKSNTLGDANGDSWINAQDMLYLRCYNAGYDGYSAGIINADLNFDGVINGKDCSYLRRFIADWPSYTVTQKPMFIALSFDDAPGGLTGKLLDTIDSYKSYDVRATFCLNGNRISASNAACLKRMTDMGMEIGNHSTFHNDIRSYSFSEMVYDINYTQDLIKQYSGQDSVLFRPPYFSTSPRLSEGLSALTFIAGNASSDTSTNVTAQQSAQTQLNQVSAGAIILLHDNNKTADTLNILIPELINRGYKIVTVSQLFKYYNVTPQVGYMYTNVLKTPQKIS